MIIIGKLERLHACTTGLTAWPANPTYLPEPKPCLQNPRFTMHSHHRRASTLHPLRYRKPTHTRDRENDLGALSVHRTGSRLSTNPADSSHAMAPAVSHLRSRFTRSSTPPPVADS